MEEKIKILEEQVESCKKYFEAYKDDESFKRRETYKQTVAYCDALESLINGYRTLEKHLGFYEKHGSYKARIIELEDQVEELKNLANNTQWISPCYVAEHYIAIEKVDKKIEKYKKLGNEFYEKFLETNKTDIDMHDAGISCDAKVQVLQELKEG